VILGPATMPRAAALAALDARQLEDCHGQILFLPPCRCLGQLRGLPSYWEGCRGLARAELAGARIRRPPCQAGQPFG
jgi:hypothetical protein